MAAFETKPVLDKPENSSPFMAQPGSRPPTKWESIKEFYRSNKWYVWAITLGVVIIGVLAFFALRPSSSNPGAANVEVSIDAPQTAASGSEVIYKVKMENKDNAQLVNLELELVYDNDVNYVSSSPNAKNVSGTLFEVPDLSSGQNAVVIIKARAQGDINEEKRLLARLHYSYSNFNSEFIEEGESKVRLVASDVGLEVSGPQNTNNSETVSYDINYVNNSDREIQNSRIEVTYPDTFTFADANPKPSLGKNIWNVGTLAKGQSGKITFQGTFKSAQPGQSQTFTANFQALDAQGNYYTQATNTYTTTISSLPLVVSHTFENSNTNIAKPGETLRYTVKYQNNGSVAATGVNIAVTIDMKAIDPNSIQAEGGSVSGGDTITWNASGASNLERLGPNESGTLRFAVKVKNPAVSDSSKNVEVKTAIKAKSNEYTSFLPGNELSVKVSSPATVTGSVKHVGGAWPLRVGQSSTFQMTVNLTNNTNDFNNAVLTGFVPSGVTFDASSVTSKESANVSYDSATGKLTWKVGILAAHTGDFNPARSLTFNVSTSPGANQVNQEVVLFRTITFIGKDMFTAQDINLKTEDLKSTSISNGFEGGRVQP